MTPLILEAAFPFVTTLLLIVILSRIAPALGLLDHPSTRKLHEGGVPVVGGIAIWVTLAVSATIFQRSEGFSAVVNDRYALLHLIALSGLLTFLGALDDRLKLSVWARSILEIWVAILVVEALGLELRYLGDILAIGNIKIHPSLSYPVTVIFIFGVINSFNMMDGLDGLLAGLVISTLVVLQFMTGAAPDIMTIVIASSLFAFLISNLHLSPLIPKCFLGDAGSKLLGFTVVCMLLSVASTQVGSGKFVEPVTILFLIATPLFDMTCIVFYRLRRGRSPFAADRSHIHHLLQDVGLSPSVALITILALHICTLSIGLFLHLSAAQEAHQFAILIACLSMYALVSSKIRNQPPRKII